MSGTLTLLALQDYYVLNGRMLHNKTYWYIIRKDKDRLSLSLPLSFFSFSLIAWDSWRGETTHDPTDTYVFARMTVYRMTNRQISASLAIFPHIFPLVSTRDEDQPTKMWNSFSMPLLLRCLLIFLLHASLSYLHQIMCELQSGVIMARRLGTCGGATNVWHCPNTPHRVNFIPMSADNCRYNIHW